MFTIILSQHIPTIIPIIHINRVQNLSVIPFTVIRVVSEWDSQFLKGRIIPELILNQPSCQYVLTFTQQES